MDTHTLFAMQIFGILSSVLLPTMLITYMHHHSLKPMIGWIIRKKPMLRMSMDAMDLFRYGNIKNGKRTTVNGYYEATLAYRAIQETLKKKSWYVKKDLDILRWKYAEVLEHLEHLAYQKRRQQEEQEQEWWDDLHAESRRQERQKTRNTPVAGWRKILGVNDNERDPKVIKTSYRKLVSKDHPDKGGTGKKMPDLNRAMDAAREELNFV